MLERFSARIPQALLLIFCCWSVRSSYELLRWGLGWSDFYGQWSICAYTLHGADPYELVGVEPPLFADIGSIPNGWGTSPWGCLLGNLFYAGYLNYFEAAVQFVLVNGVLIASAAWCLFTRLRHLPLPTALMISLSLVAAPNFWRALHQGNCGGMIGCLLIIACLLVDRRPILAGIALAFAMVKPQAALLICFAFLLKKNYRPLIVAALIDLGAWAVTSIMVERSPLTLLREFLSSDIGGNAFKGILTLAKNDLPDVGWVMPLSMLIGIAFVFVVQRSIERSASVGLEIFMPASVAATFWSYSWDNDRFILFIATTVALLLMLESRNLIERLMMFAAAALMQFSLPMMFKLNGWLSKAYEFDAWHHTVTTFETIFMLTALMLVLRLRRA
ncbi:MAG: DUF2029 domain-containing protein [Selenomonadaceae bacterium]|nr:DUF2029 domain-containing protein [Selenomonadaceae bacterium]